MSNIAVRKALAEARDRLIDRSLRNKLVNANPELKRARHVNIVDEISDEVFAILRGGKPMSFLPGKIRDEAVDDAQNDDSAALWIPPPDDAADEGGVARRHKDARLQTSLTPEGLQKRLLSMFREAQTLEEEQGVNALFLALGFLEWREAKHSSESRFAPLILLPVTLARDGAKDRFKISLRQDDLITNASLQAWLGEQFGIVLPELPEEENWTPSAYFDAVGAAIGSRAGWSVRRDQMLVGFFSFAKFLLWRDLDPKNWPTPDHLLKHPIVARVLSRCSDEAEFADTPLIADRERLDERFRVADLVHVLNADSSQAIAIEEALSGKDLVIQGPPGTGKSQTITNIIAGAVHRGKRVLFVAEKMAALNVVHKNLTGVGLAPICLEIHSRKASKEQVLRQIKQGQTAAPPPAWPDASFERVQAATDKLRAHSDRLHACNGVLPSAFQLVGMISLLKASGAPAPAFQLEQAAKWDRDAIERISGRVAAFAERVAHAGAPFAHPWRGLGVAAPGILDQERLRPKFAKFREVTHRLFNAAAAAIETLGAAGADNLKLRERCAVALAHVASRPHDCDDVLYDTEIAEVLGALRKAIEASKRRKALLSVVTQSFGAEALENDWMSVRQQFKKRGGSPFRVLFPSYRAAVAEMRAYSIGTMANDRKTRLAQIERVIECQHLGEEIQSFGSVLSAPLRALWKGVDSDWSRLSAVADWTEKSLLFEPELYLRRRERLIDAEEAKRLAKELDSAEKATRRDFDVIADLIKLNPKLAFDGKEYDALSASRIHEIAARWDDGFSRIAEWPPLRDDLKWMSSEVGCKELAQEVYRGRTASDHIKPVLMLAIREAQWNAVRAADTELERTRGDDLSKEVERFRFDDRERIRISSDQVRRAHIDRHPLGAAGAAGLLRDEMKKSRNRRPVRRLLKEAGSAVQKYNPVFLMSPLSVAQYLEPGALDFDMLVIDEASQVRPEDAIGAIARCRQIVVVGDDKQLPPTDFFNRIVNDGSDGSIDDDGAAPVRDVESILDLCSNLPQRMLKWHYRSEHPDLIATSNRRFYRNELLLPPSILAKGHEGDSGLVFRKTADGGYERGKARNIIEAEELAQSVLRHWRETPELSLGIGAFSVAQRDCILDRIELLARENPEFDRFYRGDGGREPVFVKNLENIQGDERDVIFISIGYGKDRDGRLFQNFGPLGRDGGERRLNVLITRARKRCVVFSSLTAEDIRLDSAKPGVAALKEFLKLAKDGHSDVASPSGRTFDSDFEESVSIAIRELGFESNPQVGVAGFFVDLGVIDPANRGRYILGVECDGASYHSSRYARDRDRLRQEILESRGWTIHRIWSTDWFYRQDKEKQRLRAAIEAAVAGNGK